MTNLLILAQQRGATTGSADGVWPLIWWVAAIVVAGVILFSFLMLLVQRYKRCPSNRVLVIFGKVGGGNTARCIHGGASFVWPLIQDHAYLSLEPIQIAIPLKDALSAENIRVNVPSVFTVAIGTEPEVMQNAAIRLLGLDTHQITHQAQDIIFGQLRQVIASMHIEDINRDRDKFLSSIQHSLEPELRKVGLVLINVNITDITDESGYIEAIGRKAAAVAIQQARGDVAEQEKLGEIRVAEAEREKQVQVANASTQREIGMRDAQREQSVRVSVLERDQQMAVREAQRDQAVKIAQFERDQKIAEQQAAFEREVAVKTAEREMRVKTADANAQAITGENKAQGAVAASQAELEVKRAEAYQLSETKKREAEALVQEAQHRAMAKAAIAEAERIEAEQRATLEATARAAKAKVVVDAEALAEKRRIEAEGEARAIYARLEAEARGQYEILARKGEGLSRIIEACGGANQAFQLLLLEHLDKLAETSAAAISNIKFDKVVVWENGNGDGTSRTSDFLQSLSRTLPPMMQVMKDIGGVQMPEYFARITPEARAPETNGDVEEPIVEPKA
jgi:flotillin